MEMKIRHRSCCDVNSFISADLFMSTERVFYAACSMQHTHMSHATDSSRRKVEWGEIFCVQLHFLWRHEVKLIGNKNRVDVFLFPHH